MSWGWVERTARAVTDDFGSYFWAAEGFELSCPITLFGKIAGLKQIGIPAMLRIEQAASYEKQRKEQ